MGHSWDTEFLKVTYIFINEATRQYSADSAKRNILSLIEKRGVENSQPQTGVSQEGPAKVEMNQALDGLIERQNQFIQAEAANQAEKAKAAEFQKEKKRVLDDMVAQFGRKRKPREGIPEVPSSNFLFTFTRFAFPTKY
ncbi:hypothetical protein N7461_003256 [Penicillium sp. DV-2018c]|nr:hypothetical protein N7461_003256 [Penicillium sp. DV-2018c]